MTKLRDALALALIVAVGSIAGAHTDDRKLLDRVGPFEGSGWTAAQRGLVPPNFSANGIELQAWLTLGDLGAGSDGSDCWGYVSPSGREYAIMGHIEGTVFVEVTNPASPIVIENIGGPASFWRDVKVYDEYAYMVSEGGSGVQVVDLRQIDNGTVTLVGNVNDIDTSATHNVAINTDTGFLYRCGGGSNGLRIYSLANPASPQYVNWWTDRYVHDAQIVIMQTGPFAGREIAFACSGFNGGIEQTGLDIIDVTDKQNIVNLGRVQYPAARYSHQVWISDDEQYVYLNDELEERDFGGNSRTVVIDVSDLTDPTYVGRFDNSSNAITHNNYVQGNLLFAANYQSGLRVFDLSDPERGAEIAFFDTFPNGDAPAFNGLWSVYPYFPSGTIIGSDIERGLFVWTLNIAPLQFAFPEGLPEFIEGDETSVRFTVSSLGGETIDESTLVINVREQGETEFTALPASPVSGNTYEAAFGDLTCDSTVEYFFSATTTGGESVTNPSDAPAAFYTAAVSPVPEIALLDTVETDTGWTIGAPGDDATTGIWVRVNPIGTEAQPEDDATPSGTVAWVTGQSFVGGSIGDNDVDDGSTTLTTPTLDATAQPGVAYVGYSRWFSNNQGGSPGNDVFVIDISNDGGESWTNLETVNENANAWVEVSIRIDEIISPTDNMRLRFIASDLGDGSIVEAGVDDLTIAYTDCGLALCAGDCDSSGAVDFADLVAMLGNFGGNDAACDADASGTVDFGDLVTALALFGPCE